MPRVKLTPSEERRRCLSARIQYQMARTGFNNAKVAKVLGICEKTFIDKKLHAPDLFSLSEIWKMEKLFGCMLSEPIREK
jgi:hypothetical protein